MKLCKIFFNHFLFLKLLQLFNHSLILHTSSDKNFDSIAESHDPRISLFHFPLANKHIYIITYSKTMGFRFMFLLRLSALIPVFNKDDINKVKEQFKSFDRIYCPEKNKLRIEFLKHKYNEYQNSVSLTNNKINNYLTISLAYVGLLYFLSYNIKASPYGILNIIVWSTFILSSISALNVLLLLKECLKISGNYKSSITEFNKMPSWRLLNESIFVDFASSENTRIIMVSLVRNIEKYFIRSFSLCILLLFYFFIESSH